GGKREIVPRKAGTTVADGAFQILGVDPGVESESVGDLADGRLGKLFAKPSERIGVADFRGDVRVDGQLGDFRIDEIHTRYRGGVLASPRLDVGELVSGARIGVAV